MKTLLASVLSLFLLATQAHAENRWGVLAGVDFAKTSASGLGVASESEAGFMGGIYGQFGMDNGLYIEPQLRYNQRAVDYLQIPVYAKYKFATDSMFLPVVFAGPNLGINIGSNNAKSIDFSVDVGLGGEFMLNDSMNLGLSAAYSIGLINALDGVDSSLASVKNRGFELYANLSWAY